MSCFSILCATAAGLNRCLCCASCRVDSARFPFGGRGFSLTDRPPRPPSPGQAGLTCGASAEGTGRARQEKVEHRGGSVQICFLFLTPSGLSLAVTLSAPTRAVCSCRAATSSDGRHNLRRALKGPSRCKNVSQAVMAPFNFRLKFPLGGFASVCSQAHRLSFSVGGTWSFLFVAKIRRFHVWMCGRQQRCTHLAT